MKSNLEQAQNEDRRKASFQKEQVEDVKLWKPV